MTDTADASPLHHHPPPSLPDFYSWLNTQGVIRHDDIGIQLANDGSGWGVHAAKAISSGTVLCAVPRDIILSAKTASLECDGEVDDYAGLVLQLSACLLHELRLGGDSRWYPWLQVLPRETVRVPTLWEHGELGGEDGRRGLDWLEGTEAARELAKKDADGLSLSDLETYHASLSLPATKACSDPPSLTSFLYAYSLVSSRGFVIDAYHTIGLIPFCDMFNHSSASPHTSLSVDAAVCEACGSLLPCPHDTPDPERLAQLPPEYLAQLEAEGLADKVDMRAQRDIQCGEQVLSCYDDDKRNASLLVEYGFIEDDRERNTTVTWAYRDVLTSSTLPRFVPLIQALEPEPTDPEEMLYGIVGNVIDDQPEPLQIRSNGAVSPNLLIAACLQHTPETEPDLLQEEVRDVIAEVRDAGRPATTSPLSRTTALTVGSIVDLLRSRLGLLRRADKPIIELHAVLETMTSESALERSGLTYMLSERRLLEDSLAKWLAIADKRTA